MKPEFNQANRGERGNALFLILIAVALFAALSYAVTQSGRGGGTIDREQSLIAASQITQFPASIRTTVTRMVITGTPVANLNFDTTSPAGTTEVFASEGGGAVLQDPPANIGGATAWRFKTAPGAAGAMTGWFISGVGTDGVNGKDVFAFLDGVSVAVCQSILRGLGLDTNVRVEATAVTLTGADEGTTAQVGAGNAAAVGGAAAAHAFDIWDSVTDPQAFACVRNGAGANYVYYHALVEQ